MGNKLKGTGRQKAGRTEAVRHGEQEVSQPLYPNAHGVLFPIARGTIVRGNYSEIEYQIEQIWNSTEGWHMTGRNPERKTWTGCFSCLGERVGDEIVITDERRPDDRILIIKEPRNRKPVYRREPWQDVMDFS